MVENTKIFNIAEITSQLVKLAEEVEQQGNEAEDLGYTSVNEVEELGNNIRAELSDLSSQILSICNDLDDNFKPDSEEFIKEYIKNEVFIAKNDFVSEFKTRIDSLIYEIKKVLTEETEKLMKSEIKEKDLTDLIEIRKNK
mgnify:CR=1 FL=1|tara:strand:- start:4021 stop:4443 length:423 start_codon:yes stop_codon:yes gene_type:complete